jgi:hypothetical protein
MSEGESRRVSRELISEPHITGRRISARQVYVLVEERGETPEAVADWSCPSCGETDAWDAIDWERHR